MDFTDVLSAYDYDLPAELIANTPASPRDSARLLVYDQKNNFSPDRSQKVCMDSVFRNIGDFLPEHALLVLNDTKVIPARLPVQRVTGGTVKLLMLEATGKQIRALSPKILKEGERLTVDDQHALTVLRREGDAWILEPQFTMNSWGALLEAKGETPLPPYIKHCPLTETERRREYQTVFAHAPGSIAAPTASLHFTEELLEQLRSKGIQTATVTLHVHLGTFAPLTEEQWNTPS